MFVGAYLHDILIIAVDNGKDPIEFVDALISLLKSEFLSVQTSVLPNLGLTLNNLNRYFKHEIIQDLWDMEKFSVKESMQDYETEIKTEKLYDLTKSIC